MYEMSLTYTFNISDRGCFIPAIADIKPGYLVSTSQTPQSFPVSAHSYRVSCSPQSSQNGTSQEQEMTCY